VAVRSCRVYSYTVFSFLGVLIVGDTGKRSENRSELGQYSLTTTTTTKKGKNSGQRAEQWPEEDTLGRQRRRTRIRC